MASWADVLEEDEANKKLETGTPPVSTDIPPQSRPQRQSQQPRGVPQQTRAKPNGEVSYQRRGNGGIGRDNFQNGPRTQYRDNYHQPRRDNFQVQPRDNCQQQQTQSTVVYNNNTRQTSRVVIPPSREVEERGPAEPTPDAPRQQRTTAAPAYRGRSNWRSNNVHAAPSAWDFMDKLEEQEKKKKQGGDSNKPQENVKQELKNTQEQKQRPKASTNEAHVSKQHDKQQEFQAQQKPTSHQQELKKEIQLPPSQSEVPQPPATAKGYILFEYLLICINRGYSCCRAFTLWERNFADSQY